MEKRYRNKINIIIIIIIIIITIIIIINMLYATWYKGTAQLFSLT